MVLVLEEVIQETQDPETRDPEAQAPGICQLVTQGLEVILAKEEVDI